MFVTLILRNGNAIKHFSKNVFFQFLIGILYFFFPTNVIKIRFFFVSSFFSSFYIDSLKYCKLICKYIICKYYLYETFLSLAKMIYAILS